ncbi:hypothetical protein VTH06DRAFT_2 [Thermothelomyces fergusii]
MARNAYVSQAAEAPLDGGNPFKQVSADGPIPDADAAAVSAVLSRDKPPSLIRILQPSENLDSGKAVPQSGNPDEPRSKNARNTDGHLKAGTEKGRSANGPRTAPLFRPKASSDVEQREKGTDHHGNDNDGEEHIEDANRVPEPPRRRSFKHPRSPSAAEVGAAGSDSDARRIAKRARRDSRTLLVGPGDDAREEERRMRANLARRAVVEEGEEGGAGEAPDRWGGDDNSEQVGCTKSVNPQITRGGLLRRQGLDRTLTGDADGLDGVDEEGDDEHVEAKRGDDYDVENYAEFEDDDDDKENLDPGERLG